MTKHQLRKNKVSPNYQFLVSWKPDRVGVNREQTSSKKSASVKADKAKMADFLAQEAATRSVSKDIIKSLILVSFILILEVVIYLAWNRLVLS